MWRNLVVPYVGTWIEILDVNICAADAQGRSLRGNVDRNIIDDVAVRELQRRSLRGNVDRNGLILVTTDDISTSFPTWERG